MKAKRNISNNLHVPHRLVVSLIIHAAAVSEVCKMQKYTDRYKKLNMHRSVILELLIF